MNLATSVPHRDGRRSDPYRPVGLRRPAELLTVGVLMLIFMGSVIHSTWKLRVAAERAATLYMEGTLRSALGLTVMQRLSAGRADDLTALEGSNPVRLLERLPTGYLGEVAHPELETLPAYSWHFDTATGNLIYVVGNPEGFETALPGRARVVYRIEVRRDLGSPARVTAVDLVPTASFRWSAP